MRLKPTLIFLTLLSAYPAFSQNIFVDSNKVAIFLNSGILWSETTNTISISGGFSMGGIIDFGYQGSFVSAESQNPYDNDKEEYDAHSIIVSGILTKKENAGFN